MSCCQRLGFNFNFNLHFNLTLFFTPNQLHFAPKPAILPTFLAPSHILTILIILALTFEKKLGNRI